MEPGIGEYGGRIGEYEKIEELLEIISASQY